MKNFALSILCLMPMICGVSAAQAQPANTAVVKASAVPKLVNYSGVLTDANGKPASGVTGVTFLVYKDAQGGAPLWMETQNVTPVRNGQYTVTLGTSTPEGLPADMFASGEARWLAVQADGQPEQARVLLVAVPYALKAGDAETIGGLPPSAFVLALPASAAGKSSQPQNLVASSFSSSTSTAINQTFKWQAEPAANNTANPSGTLNLLYGLGASLPTETGLLISSKGLLTFAPGQTFPGIATGTVKSVGLTAPSSDFTVSGSPVTTTGTLGLNWTVAPTSASTANAIVKRDAVGSINVNGITGTATFVTETADPYGALASTSYPTGIAILGEATSTTGLTVGVKGVTDSLGTGGAAGVFGYASNASSDARASQGVTGPSMSGNGIGVLGLGRSLTASSSILLGSAPAGVWGDNPLYAVLGTSDDGYSFYGLNDSPFFPTIQVQNYGTGPLLTAVGNIGHGCLMDGIGSFTCDGVLAGAAKQFKIDHPLDPANKFLVHASVESPDMKTVYDGVVVLEADGHAWVKLPAYVEALNGDFRYQLTCMGAFAPVYVAQETSNNQFRIAGGKSGMKVSWQITGIRHDAYAKAHPLVVEAVKQGDERGHYLHPEDFGQPNQLGIGAVHRDKMLPHAASKAGSAPAPK